MSVYKGKQCWIIIFYLLFIRLVNSKQDFNLIVKIIPKYFMCCIFVINFLCEEKVKSKKRVKDGIDYVNTWKFNLKLAVECDALIVFIIVKFPRRLAHLAKEKISCF